MIYIPIPENHLRASQRLHTTLKDLVYMEEGDYIKPRKRWTNDEIEYLESYWGEISIPSIARKLERSINAVKKKANQMGLGRHIHSGEYITYNQLMKTLRGETCSYTDISWIKNRGLPVKYKKTMKMKYRVIYLDDFWTWAEKNRTFIDFSKVEENILGKEPEWVKEQRKADILYARYKKTPWTPNEDQLLIDCLNAYKYSYREIAIKLKRTEGAIKTRILDLKLKVRPLRDPHNSWAEEETKILFDLYEKGYRPEVIAEFINRSASAIKSKIEREIL